MAQQIKKDQYPHDLFLVQDSSGHAHWYLEDPMLSNDRIGAEVEDVAGTLASYFGKPDMCNPLKVRFYGLKLNRCKEFNSPEVIRLKMGDSDYICQDKEGHIVNIQPQYNQGEDHPLNGVVMSSRRPEDAGMILEARTYSMRGECADGNPDHDLVLMRKKGTKEKESAENRGDEED